MVGVLVAGLVFIGGLEFFAVPRHSLATPHVIKTKNTHLPFLFFSFFFCWGENEEHNDFYTPTGKVGQKLERQFLLMFPSPPLETTANPNSSSFQRVIDTNYAGKLHEVHAFGTGFPVSLILVSPSS